MSSFEKQTQDKSLAMPDVDNSLAAAILGSATLKEHNLSLTFGYDEHSFLVDTAEKRTQLQQKGEQRYLEAHPFQHGLSTCSRGSLPEVIGFLPEDKELDDQELALQSSSSTDIVEDKSFLESLHVHDQSSFVCVICEEEVAVSGGELSDHSCIPSSNPSNSQAKMSSFATAIPDQICKDLRSFKKQKAQLQKRRSHMYSQQPVCMIFQTVLGMIQLCCSEVNFQASFQDRRILARE